MRAHSDHAAQVAAFLDAHRTIEAVHYPGLPGHSGHAVAARQMSGFGGMLSAQVRGCRDTTMAVAAATRVFTRATSLGGTESLIEHRASVESPTTTPENLLRLSIGLEHPDDLLEAALTIRLRYGCAALVKGGHLRQTRAAVDVFFDGRNQLTLAAPRIPGVTTHGTGCTYSAAVAGYLALGLPLAPAVKMAKNHITQAIAQSVKIARHTALNPFWTGSDRG